MASPASSAIARCRERAFVALASISTDNAFAVFRRNTIVTLAFALPTAVALAVAIVWIFRLLRKDQGRRSQMQETLELNRMLVKDTHHRVKNNLQSIISLVRMHSLPDELKTDLQTRISAMSAVHEHLYRLDQFSEVSAATLIPGIVEPLRQSFDHAATVDYDVEPLVLDRDHATPIALLVNEIVTNALKHAYPVWRGGTDTHRLETARQWRTASDDHRQRRRLRSRGRVDRPWQPADPRHGHSTRRHVTLRVRRRHDI